MNGVAQARETVSELNRLLGCAPALLAFPLGSKKPEKGTTVDQCLTDDEELLMASNIAVLVGPASGNVISIDLDTEEAVHRFEKANSGFCGDTLITRANRGCNYWFRLKGNCPPLKVLQDDGEDVGEFRSSDGSKKHWTLIQGIHPQGPDYRIINRQPVLEVSLDALTWIDGRSMDKVVGASKPTSKELFDRLTENPSMSGRRVEVQKGRSLDVKGEIRPSKENLIPDSEIEGAILAFLPSKLHQTNSLQFKLARRVKNLAETHNAKPDLIAIGGRWYDKAKRHLRPESEQPREDYIMEFLQRYMKVEKPEGATVEQAWEASKAADHHPSLAGAFPKIQSLQKLCRELAMINDDKGAFTLGGNQVAELFGYQGKEIAKQKRGRRDLAALQALEVIQLVKVGHQGVCSTYRYVLDDIACNGVALEATPSQKLATKPRNPHNG
jgi:hypothetical protein